MSEWMEACEQAGHLIQSQYRWMQERLAEHVEWLVGNPQALLHEQQYGSAFGNG